MNEIIPMTWSNGSITADYQVRNRKFATGPFGPVLSKFVTVLNERNLAELIGGINLHIPTPHNQFEYLEAHSYAITNIAAETNGWLVARVLTESDELISWVDCGFMPIGHFPADEDVCRKDTLLLAKRGGKNVKVGDIAVDGNTCSYVDRDSFLSAAITEMAFPEGELQYPCVWNHIGSMVFLKDIKIDTSRSSNVFTGNFLREFLSQVGYIWTDCVVAVEICKNAHTYFLAAMEAGFIPVDVTENAYIFAKMCSCHDFA